MKIFRLSVVFIPPFILVVVLYCLFFVKGTINIGEVNSIKNDTKQFISNSLLKQEQRLEFLTPIVDPKWFLYSVKFTNNKKIGVESDTGTPQYLEYKTLLILLIKNKELSVNYGESKVISYDTKREEILNEFGGYGFFFKGSPEQIFAPNSVVNIQDHPSFGFATYEIALSWWSILLIYIFGLIAWSGLILIAKPISQFIYYGKGWFLE